MINDLKEARYVKLRTNEPFSRFHIYFKNDNVPKELRERAYATQMAKANRLDFMTIPDERLLSHLKVFDYPDYPHAVITVNVIDDAGAPSMAANVILEDDEYKAVIEKLNSLKKEQLVER